MMDLHAHLSNYEVIGLLGGTWDPETKRIQVSARVEYMMGHALAVGSSMIAWEIRAC